MVACNSIQARWRLRWVVIACLVSRHASACVASSEISSKTLTACHGIWAAAVWTYFMHEIRFATIIAWTPLLVQMSAWKSASSRMSFTAWLAPSPALSPAYSPSPTASGWLWWPSPWIWTRKWRSRALVTSARDTLWATVVDNPLLKSVRSLKWWSQRVLSRHRVEWHYKLWYN